ncbi:MAG: hypothetical protein PUB21_07750 [Bacteroidales bacterium]|nr:hypothetical protein [Bacteroidales bacterium]
MGWIVKNNRGKLSVHCSLCGCVIKEGKDFTIEEHKAYYYKTGMADYYCKACSGKEVPIHDSLYYEAVKKSRLIISSPRVLSVKRKDSGVLRATEEK